MWAGGIRAWREITAVLVAGAATERDLDPPPCFARGSSVGLRLD
jgi:hypothetical protein